MKIGIFGGSFDPIHNAHLMLAGSAMRELKLDKVAFVPCNISNHKSKAIQVSAHDRVMMVSMCMDERDFQICLADIERKGVSYTIDTVRELKDKLPNDELFLIGGPDSVITFDNWKDSRKIRRYVKLAFANCDFECPTLDISSTLIRFLLKEGKSIKGFVPKEVEYYINNLKLYQEEN